MICFSAALISYMDRTLRPVIAKVRVRFLSKKPEFFVSFRFFFNRLDRSFSYEDHVHFHTISFNNYFSLIDKNKLSPSYKNSLLPSIKRNYEF